MIGQTIAHYRIEDKLGEGGMGVVFRARDTHLNRFVAVKVLPADRIANPERKLRFTQEARAASALNHPNIVHIYDIDTADGVDYIAMEYVAGNSLDHHIGRGLPLSEALNYAVQIADALVAAHASGIIHRDLKPGNIMVTGQSASRPGLVKLLDFGLAKLVEPLQPASESDATHTIAEPLRTEEGVIMGTVAYMSPEQAQGKKVDARSDIFSFGAVLYQMVTGRRPFSGENNIATLSAVLTHEPTPVHELLPETPIELEKLVSRCLRKDPDRRFHHMIDVKVALEELRDESESGRTGVAPAAPRRPAAWVIPTLSAVVITASILVWQALHRPAPLPAPVLTQLTFDSGLTTDPAVSPDGKLMAFASDRAGQGNLDIWLQQLATGQAARLTQDAADESEPTFSRDGSQIAFRSERQGGGIYLIPAIGGEPRLIAKEGRRPRFSPNGMHVTYWIGDWYVGRVFVAPAAGGTPVPFQAGFASAMFPVWSADGKQILFLGARKPEEAANDGFQWWIAPAAGGDAVQTGAYAIFRREKLTHGWPALVFPYDWAANEVFFSATLGATTNLWRIPLSSTSWKATGAPQRLTSGTALETKPSVSSGGTIAFSNLSSQLNIWGIPIDANRGKVTGELERLTHAAHDAHTSLSANGRTLVFLSTRAGNPDVWMKDLVSGKETALTATPQHEEQPDITRDGGMVSYMVNDNGVSSIYMMPAGGGVPEKICQDCPRPWDWSPDGSHMLYLSLPSGRMTLSLLNVAGRQKRDLITHPKYELARARFSPDGRWISAGASEQLLLGRNRMVVVPFRPDAPVADSEWVWITSDESYHDKGRWSPDGNLLYYTSDRDGYRCIRAQRLEPATKRPVGEPFDVYHSHSARRSLKNAGIELMEISVAPDRLVFNLGESTGNIWMAKFGEER